MINFPVFERLDIFGYGLFPGSEGSRGLHIDFQPGLTLILGANGLGKTTLITIIYRLLTGPFDIPGLVGRSELGTASLKPTRLSYYARKIFANRVMDNARTARACLLFRLGKHTVTIERNLGNLTLTGFAIDGQALPTNEEGTFHVALPKLAGVSSFGDWILILRYLIFYFEDRRALVWDASAQRHIFRVLLLPEPTANQWMDDERDILRMDTRMRNLSAALYHEEAKVKSSESKVQVSTNVRKELIMLENMKVNDTKLYESLEKELLEADMVREHARLRTLKAEQEREAQYRVVERDRLLAIGSRFPSRSETAKYILAQLLSNQECIVCGNHVPEIAENYSFRVDHAQCVICGSALSATAIQLDADAADNAVAQVVIDLKLSETNLREAHRALDEAETNYRSLAAQMDELRTKIYDQSLRINRLVMQLPPEEGEVHKQHSQVTLLRGRVNEMKEQLASKRKLFAKLIEEVSRYIAEWKDAIKGTFDAYAEGFLLEQCQLVWSPQKASIGQGGIQISFPAFEIDLTGTDFPTPARRTGPEQVSESQREFIDLAFRMALMSVSTNGGNGSLIMDAPESSLDAVFAPRAANVLSRFADPALGNRLLITSNLVEGQLIPALIYRCMTPTDRAERVVDLVKIAVPTAAVRQNRQEYEAILYRLLAGSDKGDPSE